jgi:hypothetical protein
MSSRLRADIRVGQFATLESFFDFSVDFVEKLRRDSDQFATVCLLQAHSKYGAQMPQTITLVQRTPVRIHGGMIPTSSVMSRRLCTMRFTVSSWSLTR